MTSSEAAAGYAVILAGGGGTRLWPASRRARPKQLLSLGGAESLLAATVRRVEPLFGAARTLVVTAADQAEAVCRALPHLPRENVLAEPVARNTAPAIALAAAWLIHRGQDDAVMAILPADHFIADEEAFRVTLRAALAHGQETIVTVGIEPTHAETGFGYVQRGAAAGKGAFAVARFVEKPDRVTAERYLAAGDYLWNAGMFFLTARRYREEAAAHLPLVSAFMAATAAATDFAAAMLESYPRCEAISVDYGVMEKARGLRVVPGRFGWNDVGSWAALAEIRARDAAGNVVVGDARAFDTRGSIVVSEEGAPFVGVVGVAGVVVVATRDGVLVVPKDRAQDVRQIVDALKAAGRKELL